MLHVRALKPALGILGAAALAVAAFAGFAACDPPPAETPESEAAPSASSSARVFPIPEADWNDAAVAWRPYEDGLAEAAAAHKPICLVFFTTWCPHCKRYSHVFADPRIVAIAKSFVMIRIDRDAHREVSRLYAVDGEYIPRTFFLSSAAVLDATIRSTSDKFHYFYDENDPVPLLDAMTAARTRFAPSEPRDASRAD
ncbi:hypothetical protein BH09MYX1_BH09MYX1_18760 [soil metagenome]